MAEPSRLSGRRLTRAYPKENAELQRQIAKEFLLVSQVPFYQYSLQDYRRNRGILSRTQ